MTPATSTIQNANSLPTYKIRTMAGDIAALKKGTNPDFAPASVGHTEILPEKTKVKPQFPKLPQDFLQKEFASEPKKNYSPPINPQPLRTAPPVPNNITPPRPLVRQSPQPFNSPIKQPQIQKMEPKLQQAPPPMDLPTAAPSTNPTSYQAPRPLTQPPLRPLPPLPPSMRPSNQSPIRPPVQDMPKNNPLPIKEPGSRKKLLLIAVLGVVLITFIIGEIWWFFVKEAPTPQQATSSQELLPPPQELAPLLPVEEEMGSLLESEKSTSFLEYDRIESINIGDGTSNGISQAINNMDMSSVLPDELVKLAMVGSIAGSETSLDNVLTGLRVNIPQEIINVLENGMDLFVFGSNNFDKNECLRAKNTSLSCYGPRLGIVFKVSDTSSMNAYLKSWEQTMISDLKALILAKPGNSTSAYFQTGTYQGETIRYKNLPLNTMTVEYSLVGDKLIISTSKNSMLKAIDSALINKDSENLESQDYQY